MAAKIGYTVIHGSSNERDHDVTEIRNNLEINAASHHYKTHRNGKGWQSARFCDYPQELVIALNIIARISQIQILSHQSNIASKIEIWVGLDTENTLKHTQSTYKSLRWKQLGYLSLDKNERSKWNARELKSVYINTMANYIKFSLHEPHVNSINLFNQVGIVALSIHGTPSHHQCNENVLNVEMSSKQYENTNKTSSKQNEQYSLSEDSEIDDVTAKKIRELTILKKQAVEQEDYDEAKRYKVCIENLKNSGKELFHLERQKRVAVQQEDYDSAKQLKLRIEQLRTLSLSVDSNNNNTYCGNPSMTQSPQQPPPSPQQQKQERELHSVLQPSAIGNVPADQKQPYGRAPEMPMDPTQSVPSHSHSMSMLPQHYQQRTQSARLRANHPDERAIRPMHRNFNTMDVSNIKNPFGARNIKNIPSSKAQPELMRGMNNTASLNSNMNINNKMGNGNGYPPPLKAAVKKDSETLIELFGEYTICLINSPNWNHRDKGLKCVVSFAQKKEHLDQRQVFKLAAVIIYQLLQDRVVSVQLSAIDSLNNVMSLYNDKTKVNANDMGKALRSIVTILVNLLGHSNTRLVDSAGSTLISLCHLDELLCRIVYKVLMKKMKKALLKHLKGRGLIMLQLVQQFGVPEGCEINHLMDNLVIAQLMHKNSETRDIGIQISTLLFQMEQHRNHIVLYLEHANLNDFIKDSLNNSFQQVTGHTNVLERNTKRFMNQTGGDSGSNTPKLARNSRNRRNARRRNRTLRRPSSGGRGDK